MRVLTFIIVLISGFAFYATYPFLLEVDEQNVEVRGQQMCERVLKANELAQLYPVPDFVECSCYAKALAINYSPARGAAFLNRRRSDVLNLANNFVTGSGTFPVFSEEDHEMTRTIFKACAPQFSNSNG